MPRLTLAVTAVPPQSCIQAAWLRSSPLASIPRAIGFGSLLLLKPPSRSYQYQTNEPMAPPYWSKCICPSVTMSSPAISWSLMQAAVASRNAWKCFSIFHHSRRSAPATL